MTKPESKRYSYEKMPEKNGVFDFRVVDRSTERLHWFPVSDEDEAKLVCNALNQHQPGSISISPLVEAINKALEGVTFFENGACVIPIRHEHANPSHLKLLQGCLTALKAKQ